MPVQDSGISTASKHPLLLVPFQEVQGVERFANRGNGCDGGNWTVVVEGLGMEGSMQLLAMCYINVTVWGILRFCDLMRCVSDVNSSVDGQRIKLTDVKGCTQVFLEIYNCSIVF